MRPECVIFRSGIRLAEKHREMTGHFNNMKARVLVFAAGITNVMANRNKQEADLNPNDKDLPLEGNQDC